MNEQEVVKLLDKISELQTTEAIYANQYNEQKKKILASVQAELDALDAEWNPIFEATTRSITETTEEVKKGVISVGHTVRGLILMGVYMSGRVTWETKYLDGYLKAHPEIAEWRKQGEPSVQIRKV